MCFSAGASFSSGAFLAVVGLVALYRAPRGYRMLAAIPLLFAIQQFSEGWLWLILTKAPVAPKGPLALIAKPLMKMSTTLSYYMNVKKVVTGVFLTFAYVIWPLWIPTTLWREEQPGSWRHALLFTCFVVGGLVSGLLLFGMLTSKMTGVILGKHIVYTTPAAFARFYKEGLAAYAFATIVPFFMSSIPGTKIIGLAVLGSFLISLHFWTIHFTSVWCFFAALISCLILWFLPKKQ